MSNSDELNLNLTLSTLNTSLSNVSLESHCSAFGSSSSSLSSGNSKFHVFVSPPASAATFLANCKDSPRGFPHSTSLPTSKHTSGHGISFAKHRVTAANPFHKTAGVANVSPLEGSKEVTQCSKARSSKLAKLGTSETNAEVLENLSLASTCRYDSSLGLLTKKFLNLIHEAPGGALDLNKTAEILEVQKRRIYDITNVLEGIGMIEKTTKNHIRWRESELFGPKELNNQVYLLKAEVEHLYAEECRLDNRIREKLEQLRALQLNQNSQRDLFLTKEDVMSLFEDETVIAVKAPRASNIEVPDPDEEIEFSQKPHYRLILRSNTGPIDLYLLSKNQKKHEDLTVKRRKPSDSLDSSGSGHKVNEADQFNPSDLQCSELSEIHKIKPFNNADADDYWLRSDHEVSATDLWGTEYC